MTSETPNHPHWVHATDCGWHRDPSQCDCGFGPSVPATDSVGPVSATNYDHKSAGVAYVYRCDYCSGLTYLPADYYRSYYCINCGRLNYTNHSLSQNSVSDDMRGSSTGGHQPDSRGTDQRATDDTRLYDTTRTDDSYQRATYYTGVRIVYRIAKLIGYVTGYREGYRAASAHRR